MNKDQILRAVRSERRATLSVLRGLDPTAFDTPTALPGWRVREVVAHLISTDRAAVTGAILPAILLAKNTDKVESWNERQVPKWANRPAPDLLMALDRWGRRFLRLAGALPAAAYRPRLPSPWGRGPLGIYIWVRAYDEWIHRQDIRRGLGMPDDDVDVEAASEFLLTAIGLQTIHQLDGGPGRLVVELEGVALPEWHFDLATKQFGPDGAAAASGQATTRIVAPAPSFLMAAAGRDRFDDLTGNGSVRVDGDEELAARFLSKLRIV
ncbi:MAG: maleylpyruvate isomerase family mycothiol-dependent enzyme [Actinomycetota bacterium]|nr:maleylpyruvate isomerase family mycothiol-dependent enzyme [Actinomycetota bacterium]